MTSLRGAEEYRELLYDMSSMLDRRLVAEVNTQFRNQPHVTKQKGGRDAELERQQAEKERSRARGGL